MQHGSRFGDWTANPLHVRKRRLRIFFAWRASCLARRTASRKSSFTSGRPFATRVALAARMSSYNSCAASPQPLYSGNAATAHRKSSMAVRATVSRPSIEMMPRSKSPSAAPMYVLWKIRPRRRMSSRQQLGRSAAGTRESSASRGRTSWISTQSVRPSRRLGSVWTSSSLSLSLCSVPFSSSMSSPASKSPCPLSPQKTKSYSGYSVANVLKARYLYWPTHFHAFVFTKG
mmetsp:Transcript_124234/g.356957  ORF Transcript_124234/g.356957 Transcript_124234/m.356957 type:complete len:231 (-) Transcript_124234:570-1262(-)